jgi:hypothetical protein
MYFDEGSALELHLTELAPPGESSIDLLLLPEGEQARVPALMALYRARGAALMGGVFPAVIGRGRMQRRGGVFKRMAASQRPFLVEDLPNSFAGLGASYAEGKAATGLMLVDGLSPGIGDALDWIYDRAPVSMRFAGGGAGRSDFSTGPCLFTAERFVENAALLACFPSSMQMGVAHGWQPMDHAPLVASAMAEDNVIAELEWQPAASVYRRMLSAQLAREVPAERLAGHFGAYPFGFFAGDDTVVRDVLHAEGEHLICAGKIRRGTVLQPMVGRPERLLEAAAQVVDAMGPRSGPEGELLVFDCISRAQFLGARIDEELSMLQHHLRVQGYRASLEGALTIGEIAQADGAPLEFYNKSLVAGHLPHPNAARPIANTRSRSATP